MTLADSAPAQPAPTRRRRINATLSGDFLRLWDEEKARGGSDGEVLSRFIDRAASRSSRQVRAAVVEQLIPIKTTLAETRVLSRDPLAREKAVAAEAAADRIRSILGTLNHLDL